MTSTWRENLLDGRTLAGECKWRRQATGFDVLENLRKTAAGNGFYGGRPENALYLLFSRGPATADLKRAMAEDKRIFFVRPSDLIGTKRRKR